MLKKIRTILALVFFIGITLLFLDFTGTAHRWLDWMAKVQFLPAVLALNAIVVIALIVLTLIFGRIYCSVICPLGVMQDIFAWLGKKAKKNRYSYSKALSWLRYTVLGVFIVALVAGIGSIFQLLAPYSAYGRIATTIFQPLWKLGNNGLAAIAERIDSYAFYSIVIADVRAPRDGKFTEKIGTYNPNTNPATVDLKFDRALYWVETGAQPTDTVRNILSDEGVYFAPCRNVHPAVHCRGHAEGNVPPGRQGRA